MGEHEAASLRLSSVREIGFVHAVDDHHPARIVFGEPLQPEVVRSHDNPTCASDQVALQPRREPRKNTRLIRTKSIGRPLVTEVCDPWNSCHPADDQSRDVAALRR
jgi:hypothetical protein